MYIFKCDFCEHIVSVMKAYKDGWLEINVVGKFEQNKKIMCPTCSDRLNIFVEEKEAPLDNASILEKLKEEGIL